MITLWVLAAILIAHTVVFRAATRWTRNRRRFRANGWQVRIAQAILGLTVVTAPWYVRYADRLSSGIDRLARRQRPRVAGQVYLVLKPDFSSALRPRADRLSAHMPPPAIDLTHHYPSVHWGFAPDGAAYPIPLDELRPGSSEGGIHPTQNDQGGWRLIGHLAAGGLVLRPEPLLATDEWDRGVALMKSSFADFTTRMLAAFREAFHELDVLMREIDPIYDHRRRREERLAAKRPELTALWTAYHHKTRRRNRRRRNR